MKEDASAVRRTRDLLAQEILPTLHRQRWSLDTAQGAALGRVVHLSAGRGELTHTQGLLALRAPDVLWLPAGAGRALRFEPGSEAVIVGISDSMLAVAIGNHADSAALRQLTARLSHISVHESRVREEILRSMRAIETDARSVGGGSWHYQAAHVTIVLALMCRLAGREHPVTVPALGRGAHRLRRFRQLVEAQFREHWPVARYAAELAISPDRLHDMCISSLQRTPSALVHQRLAHEATLLLAGSDQSIERLASDLGFGSASHFSRFFKRWMSVGPKAYRDRVRALAAAGGRASPTSYADWP